MHLRLSILITLLVSLQLSCTGQKYVNKDKLVDEICKALQAPQPNEDDSTQWVRVYE